MTETTDKQLPDDQQLEEYLKGDSSVSRQYRELPGAEVPGELDRLVLRQAAEAVKKRATSRPAWVRWAAPLGVAASAVLVLSIVVEHGVRDVTVQEMVAQDPAPVPTQSQAFSEPSNDNQAAGAAADAVSPTSAPSRPPPPPVAAPARAPAVSAGESLARSADMATRMVESEKREDTRQTQPAAVANERAPGEERSDVKASAKRIHAAAPPPAPALAKVYSDPEAWLEDIRQLRKENKQEQADREWRRFRAAFPDYEVSEADTARESKK